MKKFNAAFFLLMIISYSLTASALFSQNITNTIGNGGNFVVKDTGKIHLSISQSTGNLTLNSNMNLPESVNQNTGVIFKGGQSFMHDFKPGIAMGYNTFIGLNSGNFNMNGSISYLSSFNTAVGSQSLFSITNATYSSAFGYQSLYYTTSGTKNSAFGTLAMQNNTTGSFNSSFGSNSLMENTDGFFNSAFGFSALNRNTSGDDNSAFGHRALQDVTTGFGNSAFGTHSLENATGNRNTAIGDSSGRTLISGSNNIMIGYNSLPSSTSISNQITLGNNQITSLRCNVQSITSLSDRRDKRNIEDLTLGLEFISRLKPRMFYWDKREWYENNISDGSRTEKTPTAGFIAQELDEAQNLENADWLNLVLKDNPDKMEATYGNLLPVLVKAVQELKEKNDKLETELNSLKDEIKQSRQSYHSQKNQREM